MNQQALTSEPKYILQAFGVLLSWPHSIFLKHVYFELNIFQKFLHLKIKGKKKSSQIPSKFQICGIL